MSHGKSPTKKAVTKGISHETVRCQLNQVDWDINGFVPSAGIVGIHGLHWYPAPFPPALASTLIDILGSGGIFLDPFSGSGVAPIEAWLRGYEAYGIDNNEFAVRIGRAKTELLMNATAAIGEELATLYKNYRARRLTDWLGLSSSEICDSAHINADAQRWFLPQMLAEIAVAKSWISDLAHGPGYWSNVATVLLSSLLHGDISIVRGYHYTYVVDRSRVKHEALESVDVRLLYCNRLTHQFSNAELLRRRLERTGYSLTACPAPMFLRGNACYAGSLISKQCSLIVTSPPYFGMNDYVRSQYLTWLIFPWDDYESQIDTEVGSRRKRWNRLALDEYLSTMEETIENLCSKLSEGGYLAIVVGEASNALAREADLTGMLRKYFLESQLEPVWEGHRRIRFRKINHIPYRTEVIWVFHRK